MWANITLDVVYKNKTGSFAANHRAAWGASVANNVNLTNQMNHLGLLTFCYPNIFCHVAMINLIYKSRNAPDPYPTMYHFVTEMCTYVHISDAKWCIMGYLSDALWDFLDGSINFMDTFILLNPRVYLMKYKHSFCFALFCFDYIISYNWTDVFHFTFVMFIINVLTKVEPWWFFELAK